MTSWSAREYSRTGGEPCFRLIPTQTVAVAPGCPARTVTTAGTAPNAAAAATAEITGNTC